MVSGVTFQSYVTSSDFYIFNCFLAFDLLCANAEGKYGRKEIMLLDSAPGVAVNT